MNVGRHTIAATAIALALLTATACDSDGDSADPDSTAAPATVGSTDRVSSTAPGEITAPDPTTVDTATAATDGAPTTESATTTIGTVPDEGVPGIDSTDEFCRSWSEFAGSFQALAVATSFGSDPDAAARLEVAASPAIVATVHRLDVGLPAELQSERTVFITELAGPMFRRAERARSELMVAELSDAAIDDLGAAWLTALTEAGLDDPDLAFTVPDGVDPAAFDSAVATFREALPPINQDPSLISDAQIPLIEQYLSATCPDQGTLGGNDVIDEI